MKLFRVSLFLALLVAISLPAVAQSTLQLNIPFNFSVGGIALPAGQYRVVRLDDNQWRICEKDGAAAIMFTIYVESPGTDHQPSLVRFWPTAHFGRELPARERVRTKILAEAGTFVEIGAE